MTSLDWIDRPELVADTLIISGGERSRLITLEQKGLSVIRPVALPIGSHLLGSNRHLGWPVGIKVGKSLLCAYHRTRHHHGSGPQADADSSHALVVRSTNGGATWSEPCDLRAHGINQDPMVLDFGNCFGVAGNKVLLATKYGVYRSEDEGESWILLRGALTQAQTGHAKKGHFGPRMINHPERGMVIPVGVTHSPSLDLYSSHDEGVTWTHERFSTTEAIHPIEPTAIHHDGHLVFLTRNHPLPFKFHGEIHAPIRPAMLVSNTGWFPMKHQGVTNISSHRWPDTTDIDFNPVSHRYEAVVTNRNGGVLENERHETKEQSVNLWSISPENLYAGRADRWRFEATLLTLVSGMLEMKPNDIDAAHPGGSVIDESAGVQHIFIYCGRYATPTGIYRISRTLDTFALSKHAVR